MTAQRRTSANTLTPCGATAFPSCKRDTLAATFKNSAHAKLGDMLVSLQCVISCGLQCAHSPIKQLFCRSLRDWVALQYWTYSQLTELHMDSDASRAANRKEINELAA